MAVFKCKMCGGTLEVNAGESVIECSYCGNMNTLPKLDDDRRVSLYDRANHYMQNNEYDKAMSTYEKILEEDKTDAEAYWSIVLCRYGIEYVEDPTSHKRIPTINRMQMTSILADQDYKSALKYADSYQKSVYEQQAKDIADIQKGILEIVNNEEPFDIFICYKETDNNGRRTQDSVLAQELYYGLKNEGFKVFFSRITLEDKLGVAYEPYIFSALQSSKVMVVLGTKPEHFNAVWVKNEWLRYLALIRNGEKKTIIPAYKDMDPYDIPDELSHLQAQDMSKLGFLQDMIRGIKKVVQTEPEVKVVKEVRTENAGGNANVNSLLKRIAIFLEDGDYDKAEEYCQKVLDIDPENSMAYLYLAMCEYNTKDETTLAKTLENLSENGNIIKAKRYAIDDKQREKIDNIIQANLNAIKQDRYNFALGLLNNKKYEQAKEAFGIDLLQGFKDSAEMIDRCIEERNSELYNAAMELYMQKQYSQAAEAFDDARLANYKDSKSMADKSEEMYKEQRYVLAQNTYQRKDYLGAQRVFEGIKGYKDSAEMAEKCVEDYCETHYDVAIQSYQAKDYYKAIANMGQCVKFDYKDSKKLLEQYKETDNNSRIYNYADNQYKQGKLKEALANFKQLAEKAYLDSETRQKEIQKEIEKKQKKVKKIKLSAIIAAAMVVVIILTCVMLTFVDIEESGLSINIMKSEAIGLPIIMGSEVRGITKANPDGSCTIPSKVCGKTVKYIYIREGSVCEASKIIIPSTVAIVYIANPKIKEVVLADGWTSIGYGLFDCPYVTSITIPGSVTSIRGSAFSRCSSLTNITIGNGVTSIEDWAFDDCSSLKSVTIGNSVTSIGEEAFSGCSSLKSITIPNSVTSIGEEAFSGCSSLTSITIPDSVTSIGHSAFEGCSRLTSIIIGNSVTSIGRYAFSGCSRLTKITIPNSVTSIGGGAFSGCSSITEMTIPFVGAEAGKTSSDTYQYPFGYIFGTSSYTGGEFTAQDYYGSSTSSTTNNTYYIPSSLKSVTVTGGNILYGAFYGCDNLTSITIPNSVTSIGDFAFYDCTKLTSITIPDSVTSIGEEAFRWCRSLTSITIPDSVTSIGEGAFWSCSSLTSITIPNSVTSIEDYTFQGCSSLTRINFQGTQAQWNAISKGISWNYGTGKYTIYCTNGTISE